jgi:polyhydroxyalkanoate synthesis repressor PhaR
MPRIIKRYANRKLYDTESSTYITLENIEGMVREGEDVSIVDNSSGEDITSATLAHIVLEQQRANPSFPVSVLRGIIQSGEEFFARLQWPVTQFRDEFRRRAESLEEGSKAIREFVDGTQRSVDEMQSRLDERFRDAVGQLTHIPKMRQEIDELRATLEALEERLRDLEEAD